jgi:ubiquinone/menaquinone biosynthesis C-methylase UbiE
MKYPKYDVYEAMYAKYLDPESLKILMDLAGEDMTGKKVLDVCGGTGICTEEALRRNAQHVDLLDGEYDMVPPHFRTNSKVSVTIDNAHLGLTRLGVKEESKFDIAVCRQAINYWFDARSIAYLAGAMKSGGVFVFNTFNTRPSETPKIKQYHHKGISFTEISYVDPTNFVHHVQIREGMAPHVARFQWIAPESFDLFLGKYFDIEKTTRNRTDYYRCVKK